MTTKSVTLSNTAYTKLDTGSETSLSMQNVSDRPVRLVFAGSLPSVTVAGFFDVNPGQGVSRDGMTGDMYALAADADNSGKVQKITVGE